MYESTLKLLILFGCCIVSTLSSAKATSFENYMHKNWASSYRVKLNENITNKESVNKPEGTKIVLANVFFLNNEFERIQDCLIYKVPKKSEAGALSIVHVEAGQDCRDHLYSQSVTVLKPIYNLGIDLQKNKLKLSIDKREVNISLLNTNEKKIIKISMSDSIITHPLIDDGETCFDVDSKCSIVQTNTCSFCKTSSYQVIASNCPTAVRKICGVKKCGIKGNPACIRGVLASGYKGDYCIPDSPIGICEKGLRVFCEKGELICN